MLFLNGSLPRIEDVINPLSFTFKLHLPQYEAVIWISVFVALDDIVSGWSIWSWWLDSQQSTFWKRGLVASELIDVSSLVGYVENFPTCSANGTWIGSSTQTLQKVLHASLSSGLSNLQILVDSIVPLLALCSGLVLIEITGFFIVRNLVPLVITLSCLYNLCTILCLIVVAFVMGGVPKLCLPGILV
ncbi:hypothetical protein Bca52824_025563 [Brassica carinata]|uniref:Uncharacterized protein n=1 Tax=Brassica carinata TaxID=52824 RepID=A0A8X7SI58_BRACI|nr:hypothetical protein Bca52824_025563 [Brassica carinata]